MAVRNVASSSNASPEDAQLSTEVSVCNMYVIRRHARVHISCNGYVQQKLCLVTVCHAVVVLLSSLSVRACSCLKQFARYTCPRCGLKYCSLSCYRSEVSAAPCIYSCIHHTWQS